MANFGKKAKLECQKGTVKVECVVSVYGESIDNETGKKRYKVVVQRLQDNVTREQAEQGLADALPFITNRKQWQYDEDGNSRASYTHYDYVTEEMMDAIRKAARNCYKTTASIEDTDGATETREIENYCVKLDIGFNPSKGEAFFYRIKQGVTPESLAKDIKYNMRHMPASGRVLTAAILEGHKNITDIASKVYADSLRIGKKESGSDAAGHFAPDGKPGQTPDMRLDIKNI